MMVPSSDFFPAESWCAAARDRRGRLRRGAAVAAERQLDRRCNRRANDRRRPPSESLNMADENLYQYFKIEAREIVADLSRDILGLERAARAPNSMLRLLRQAHTLKGAARVVRLPRIAEIAHAMEDALTPYRGSPEAVSCGPDRPAACTKSIPSRRRSRRSTRRCRRIRIRGRRRWSRSTASASVVAEMDALLSGVSETAVQLDGMRMGFDAVKQVEDRLAASSSSWPRPRPRRACTKPSRRYAPALQHARQGLSIARRQHR